MPKDTQAVERRPAMKKMRLESGGVGSTTTGDESSNDEHEESSGEERSYRLSSLLMFRGR